MFPRSDETQLLMAAAGAIFLALGSACAASAGYLTGRMKAVPAKYSTPEGARTLPTPVRQSRRSISETR